MGGSYNSKLLSYIKQSFSVASCLNLSLNHNKELKGFVWHSHVCQCVVIYYMSTDCAQFYMFFVFQWNQTYTQRTGVKLLLFPAGSAVWVCFTGSLLGRLWQAVHYVFLVSDITMSFFIVNTLRASASISLTMVWWNRPIPLDFRCFLFFFVVMSLSKAGVFYVYHGCYVHRNSCNCVVVIVSVNCHLIFSHHR